MLFTRLALASTALLAVAVAQTKIAFTAIPAVVRAGDTYNITWGGGNGDPVTLTLRQGDPNDLQTIEVLADGVTGDSYEWKVATDLDSASDYALQIQQGLTDINYSGLFAVSGGRGSSSIPYTASSTSTSSENSTSTTSGESSSTTNGTSSSTESSNSTESSTTTDSSTSETSSVTTTSSQTSRTGAATAVATQTNAPDSASSAVQLGSSVAFAMAVLGAVLMMN